LRRESRNSWGGRKLAQLLAEEGGPRLAPSTITSILRRAGLLDPTVAPGQCAWQRFEHVAPNALWQMDFKGYFPLLDRSLCHPLTVLDDHSRCAVLLQACTDQRGATVRNALTSVFRRYGLPAAMLMDNGSPWGDRDLPFTALSLWLVFCSCSSISIAVMSSLIHLGGRMGRGRVMLLLKEGTSLFSDFGGILRKEFRSHVREKVMDIERDLVAAGLIKRQAAPR
jgi:hypothetical protein